MTSTRFVCAIALLLLASLTLNTAAQTRGVSVQMVKTKNALTYPAADNNDAWIIAVTADGSLYFGVKPVTPEELVEQMTSTPRYRDANVYIKADARTTFAQVESALSAARTNGFDSPVLLTMQPESAGLGKLVAPQGLEVSLGSTSDSTLVDLTGSSQDAPDVKVNGQPVHLADLRTALNQALQNSTTRTISLKADRQLTFAQVASVIDACTSVKAKVVLAPGAH